MASFNLSQQAYAAISSSLELKNVETGYRLQQKTIEMCMCPKYNGSIPEGNFSSKINIAIFNKDFSSYIVYFYISEMIGPKLVNIPLHNVNH